jgi:hypothetical protein
MKAMIIIVKQEKRNAFIPNVLKAAVTMRPSIAKITTPIFTEKATDINWANKSVPPVLALYRSINPTPIPMNAPPNNALLKIENINWVLKGANQSMVIEATINPIKLLKKVSPFIDPRIYA